MQQHVVSSGGQKQQSAPIRVQKLRLQATRRLQLRVRQQDYARSGRTDAYQPGRGERPHSAPDEGPRLSQVQPPRGRLLPGPDAQGRGGDAPVLRVHELQAPLD